MDSLNASILVYRGRGDDVPVLVYPCRAGGQGWRLRYEHVPFCVQVRNTLSRPVKTPMTLNSGCRTRRTTKVYLCGGRLGRCYAMLCYAGREEGPSAMYRCTQVRTDDLCTPEMFPVDAVGTARCCICAGRRVGAGWLAGRVRLVKTSLPCRAKRRELIPMSGAALRTPIAFHTTTLWSVVLPNVTHFHWP